MYEMDEREVAAVRRVILSKKLFRYQKSERSECDLFEREFADRIGVGYAVLLSSGTNALVAALTAAGIRPGDEVLVPAYTFIATASAVRMAGAQPVIVNIDENLGMSALDAKAKLTRKTKAIIPVHMDGLSADLAPLAELARKAKLTLIEDCAQAIGGSYRGQRLGSIGDIGAYSLNENKNISCGEGGIVVTSDEKLYGRLFCAHDSAARFNPAKQKILQASDTFLGMSMRVSEIQGAIMRVQLKRLESILKRLRERKKILVDGLAALNSVRPIFGADEKGDCASSLHLRFESPLQASVASKLLLENGINALFPVQRPAHVAWKWLDIIDPMNAKKISAGLNPSVMIVMSTLKYDIDLGLSLAETRKLAKRMRALIASV